MGPRALYSLVEGARGAPLGVRSHGADHVGGVGEALGGEQFQTAEREHGLGAVDQRDSLLGSQGEGLDRGAPQGFAAGHTGTVIIGLAFADEDQRHVRERARSPLAPTLPREGTTGVTPR